MSVGDIVENVHHVGILAYGSLIFDPGDEILASLHKRIHGVRTPFPVEFARSSRLRDGAPTLVPVETGGAHVQATVFVMKREIGVPQGKDMLWRRETDQVGSDKRYTPSSLVGENTVVILEHANTARVGMLLATKIASNIPCLTARTLAELAVRSARGEAGARRRDGITYLKKARTAGIVTPLIDEYEEEVLQLTGVETLDDAWREVRAAASKD